MSTRRMNRRQGLPRHAPWKNASAAVLWMSCQAGIYEALAAAGQMQHCVGDHQLDSGASIGSAADRLLGSMIGGGNGRDVAAVFGVLDGGTSGDYVRNRYADKRIGQNIVARLDNGVHVAVTPPADSGLRVDDRVMIEGGVQNTRVIRR